MDRSFIAMKIQVNKNRSHRNVTEMDICLWCVNLRRLKINIWAAGFQCIMHSSCKNHVTWMRWKLLISRNIGINITKIYSIKFCVGHGSIMKSVYIDTIKYFAPCIHSITQYKILTNLTIFLKTRNLSTNFLHWL